MSDSNEGRCLQNVYNDMERVTRQRVEKMTATGAAAPPRSPVGLGRSCPISQSQGQCGEGYASRASTRARGRETG